MPDNWLEKQRKIEKKIRAELSDVVIEAVGGRTGQKLISEADRKRVIADSPEASRQL